MTGGDYISKIDLVGKRFGKLTVEEMLYNYNGTGRTKCSCRCDCGKTGIIRIAYTLQKAKDSSCGCGRREYIRKSCGKEITGQRFGRLIVLETLWEESPPKVKCLCDCGNIVVLRKNDVQDGHTRSCGCLQRECASSVNYVDHTDEISDYGVKIIKPHHQNNLGQWLWECECGVCNNHFTDIPARIMNGHVRSCGCLKSSSNETYISKVLDDLNIQYKTQYTFPDCKSDKNYPLYFDFAVFKDGKIFCLIEYDGEQHFHPVEPFGGEEGYKRTKIRDCLKDKYCKDKNIQLFRFSYMMTSDEIKEKIINTMNP